MPDILEDLCAEVGNLRRELEHLKASLELPVGVNPARHTHSKLDASDGAPAGALSLDATGNGTMADSTYLASDEFRARDSGGVYVREDSGTYGLQIQDDGDAVLKLGDAAGARSLVITDSGDVTQLTVNSDGDVSTVGKIIVGPGTTLTIAAGVITVTGSWHWIDTQGLDSTDDLDTINGGVEGQLLFLRSVNAGRDTTIKHNTGNIYCGADFTLTTTTDMAMLMYSGTVWRKISFADNA